MIEETIFNITKQETPKAENDENEVNLHHLLDKPVNVKWGRKWYPAELKIIEDQQGFVEFDDQDFENEWIDVHYIRARTEENTCGDNNATDTTTPGAFQKDIFKKYVQSFKEDENLLEFNAEQIRLIRSSIELSRHAAERADERYVQQDNTSLQEFWRAVQTPKDCFYYLLNRFVLIFSIAVEYDEESKEEVAVTFDHSFSKVLKVERDYQQPFQKWHLDKCDDLQAARGGVALQDTASAVVDLIQEYEQQNDGVIMSQLTRFCSDSDIESMTNQAVMDVLQHKSYLSTSVNVISTTSTLILSKNLSKIVTCYPNKISFGNWKKTIFNKKTPAANFEHDHSSRKGGGEDRVEKINRDRIAKGKQPIGTSGGGGGTASSQKQGNHKGHKNKKHNLPPSSSTATGKTSNKKDDNGKFSGKSPSSGASGRAGGAGVNVGRAKSGSRSNSSSSNKGKRS